MLDHHMPGMDGIEVARRIRHDTSQGRTRLMMLSSVSDQIDPDELARVGVAACLNKPVRQSALYNALAAAFCNQRAGSGGGRTDGHASPAVHEVAFSGRVLLAEDNVVNQEVAVNMLEGLNCRVTVAGNGIEALAALERESFDLVLMDCQMPDLDGFATTAEIRRREAAAGRSPRPILALTANAMEGDRERCIEAGMDDYLSKPFTREALAAMLGRYLQPAATSGKPAAAAPQAEAVAAGAGVDPAGQPPVIDLQALKPIIALARPGRPSPLVKVISLYLDAWPEQNEKLRLAVATTDAEAMWKLAHALKSSSAIVGALGLASIFKHLEALGRSGTTAGANEAFAEIERLFPAIRQALLAICKEQAA